VSADEFESVRAEADPLRQARRATDLLGAYQQRSVELARLRRDAINRTVHERGMTYAAVADAIGLSKGRITQIRQSAPPTERAFFGVGPVTVAIPERRIDDRPFPVLSAEDTQSAQLLTELLDDLNFAVVPARVPPEGGWLAPDGDVVAICGPKSSPTIAQVLEADPVLRFEQDDDGDWFIADRTTGETWRSGMDQTPSQAADVAYVGRTPHRGGYLLVIAGVHAIGSLGAVTWLREHLAELHSTTEGKAFGMVIGSTYDGLTITSTEVLCDVRTY
jgi:hypothetical protein